MSTNLRRPSHAATTRGRRFARARAPGISWNRATGFDTGVCRLAENPRDDDAADARIRFFGEQCASSNAKNRSSSISTSDITLSLCARFPAAALVRPPKNPNDLTAWYGETTIDSGRTLFFPCAYTHALRAPSPSGPTHPRRRRHPQQTGTTALLDLRSLVCVIVVQLQEANSQNYYTIALMRNRIYTREFDIFKITRRPRIIIAQRNYFSPPIGLKCQVTAFKGRMFNWSFQPKTLPTSGGRIRRETAVFLKLGRPPELAVRGYGRCCALEAASPITEGAGSGRMRPRGPSTPFHHKHEQEN